jgi:hypothetical protein
MDVIAQFILEALVEFRDWVRGRRRKRRQRDRR